MRIKIENYSRVVLAILIVITTTAFVVFFNEHMTLQGALSEAQKIKQGLGNDPSHTIAVFFLIYTIANALPLPFLSVPTVIAGYLFGGLKGLILVSFASAIGATMLFLCSRYLFRNWMQKQIRGRHPAIEQATSTTSFWFASTLRFLPGVPFSVPTIALSLSNLSLFKFYFSTQIGMLTILFIYVNAGSSLASLESIDDVFSARLLSSLLLVLLVPTFYVIARKLQSRRLGHD